MTIRLILKKSQLLKLQTLVFIHKCVGRTQAAPRPYAWYICLFYTDRISFIPPSLLVSPSPNKRQTQIASRVSPTVTCAVNQVEMRQVSFCYTFMSWHSWCCYQQTLRSKGPLLIKNLRCGVDDVNVGLGDMQALPYSSYLPPTREMLLLSSFSLRYS